MTPLITSWCSPRGEAVGSFLFSLLQNILQPDQANVPSQRGPWVSPCPCTAPSGGSDWTSHFALGTASASVRPATATARSVAQQAGNSSLDLGGSSLNPSQPGVFCSAGTTYNRLGLLELGVPRSDGARGTGPAGNRHSPALDPSPGFATVPRGTSCLCSQQHHLKIIILAGIPGLSLQWNVFRIIPKWLCLGLIGSTN